MRRKLDDKNIRKIFQSGASNAVTIPKELMTELGWRKGQKLVLKKEEKWDSY